MLALAVLSLFLEAPRHPYDVHRQLRLRGKQRVLDIRPAPVYRMIDRLAQADLIAVAGTNREGKRPERTIYEITDRGRELVPAWLRRFLRSPADEHPTYRAAVAFLPLLTPEDALQELDARAAALEAQIAADEALTREAAGSGPPRLFLLEDELGLAMLRTELAWTRAVVDDLRVGRLHWTHDEVLALVSQAPLRPED